MSENTPTLVVTKDFIAFGLWLNTKPVEEREKYRFVADVIMLKHYPDAPGLLVGDWANRSDAGDIHLEIQARKARKEQKIAKMIFDSMLVMPNTTMVKDYGGKTYQLTNNKGIYFATIDGVLQQYNRNDA